MVGQLSIAHDGLAGQGAYAPGQLLAVSATLAPALLALALAARLAGREAIVFPG